MFYSTVAMSEVYFHPRDYEVPTGGTVAAVSSLTQSAPDNCCLQMFTLYLSVQMHINKQTKNNVKSVFSGHAKQLSGSKWAFWPRASSVRLDSFPGLCIYHRQKSDQHRIASFRVRECDF